MTLSILAQFDRVCDDCGGDIICSRCGNEIHQYYHWWVAADHIEHDRCPICDCEGGSGTYEWCEQCRDDNCEGWQKIEVELEAERAEIAYGELTWQPSCPVLTCNERLAM